MERSSIVEVLDNETIDWTGPWGEFVDANSDGMSPEEVQDIAETLARGETYHGGGGSMATFQLRRAA